jgi:hypothetical protein
VVAVDTGAATDLDAALAPQPAATSVTASATPKAAAAALGTSPRVKRHGSGGAVAFTGRDGG